MQLFGIAVLGGVLGATSLCALYSEIKMDVEERLALSIKAGEILDIIYYGGSIPGKSRKVVPVKLDGNKLIAKCLSSNEVKTFTISKIAIQEDGITIGADSSVLTLKFI